VTETAGRSRVRTRIGKAWIDSITSSQAIEAIEHLVASGTGGFVVTPNVDHVVNLERDPDLRQAYEAASLTLVDGQPLVWASRLLGAPLPERISGADLVPLLMERAAARHWRVYLVGAGPGVAEMAAKEIRRIGVEIVGTDAPLLSSRLDASESADVVERIRRARPHLVLVAFGSPKQERWMFQVQEQIRPALSIGVGAALDFVAGRVKRAPRWMSRSGLEWLFRLSREPRRLWRRYLVNDPRFLFIVLRMLRMPRAARVRQL